MSHCLTRLKLQELEPGTTSERPLYTHRRLADGHPGLDRLAFDRFSAVLEEHGDETPRMDTLLERLNRLVDLDQLRDVVVIGCGPKPQTIKLLAQRNYNVVGVEPVPLYVESAREYIGSREGVLEGAAEAIPLPTGSQHIVFCDSVLEHVVSPSKSLDEMFRVLAPRGIAIVTTTNKLRISLSGHNGEYKLRFFNWLPGLVKECFVFEHLHYNPRLANYSELPAVHWFSYASLCTLGRQAGFAQFYSPLDLLDSSDPEIRKSRLKKWLLNKVKFNPWLRALALTQRGDTIIMLKK
jgi:ubiquinone/menaquinone biosynthesis C-methylase UbiE